MPMHNRRAWTIPTPNAANPAAINREKGACRRYRFH